jgi:hypothetical protein
VRYFFGAQILVFRWGVHAYCCALRRGRDLFILPTSEAKKQTHHPARIQKIWSKQQKKEAPICTIKKLISPSPQRLQALLWYNIREGF